MRKLDLGWIVGRKVEAVRLVEPASWWFEFTGGGSIRVDSLWRVLASGRVQASSDDHGQKFGLPTHVDSTERARFLLRKAAVRKASLRGGSGDLILEFDRGSTLEVLVTSAGYESWALFCPNGDEVIALGGGQVHVARRDG